jgi:hypothetical protein
MIFWYPMKFPVAERNDVKGLMEKHKGKEVILFKKDRA